MLSDTVAWIFVVILIVILSSVMAMALVSVVLYFIIPFPWSIIVEILWWVFCILVIMYIIYRLTKIARLV